MSLIQVEERALFPQKSKYSESDQKRSKTCPSKPSQTLKWTSQCELREIQSGKDHQIVSFTQLLSSIYYELKASHHLIRLGLACHKAPYQTPFEKFFPEQSEGFINENSIGFLVFGFTGTNRVQRSFSQSGNFCATFRLRQSL